MSKVGPFILGGLVGAAIGILYAPRTGDQTRALLAEKIGAVWGEAKDFGANVASDPQGTFQGVVSKGQEFAKTATDSAGKALGAVQGRVKDATGQVDPAFGGTGDGDELRAKVKEKCEHDFQRPVYLVEHVEPKILGGIIIEARGHRRDASVRTHLVNIRKTLSSTFVGGDE